MRELLLEFLRCPRCSSMLRSSGEPPREAVCTSCGGLFPWVRGALRLAGSPNDYTASFGRQWNRYEVARHEEDEEVFRVKTGISAAALKGRLVLDAGCGGGRYARLAAREGAQVVGIDLSAAVDKAAQLCAEYSNALIAQADLLNLPVADRSFDLVYSIGVLHHTPDPRRAFAQIAGKVKPGGRLAVWLYRRNTPLQELVNSTLRALTTRLPPHVLEPLCAALGVLGSIPVLNKSLNKVFNFSNHPDWTLRVCDNFDWYAPRFQSHHALGELETWFEEEGFHEIRALAPAKQGRLYEWSYERNLIIGSGVNVVGTKG